MTVQDVNVLWHRRLAVIVCHLHFRENSLRSNNVFRQVTSKFQLQRKKKKT